MASIDTYLGFIWGVDKITITEGDGSVQPQVTGAVAIDANTVRVTYDQEMMFLEEPSSVLKLKNYLIEDSGSNPLPLFWASQYSTTQVDLHTMDQVQGESYTLTVDGVESAWGVLIDPAHDTAGFTGVGIVYPAFSEMHSFFGLDIGMQGERVDVSAPYLDNENPAPLQSGVSLDANIQFDLLDAEDNINLSTVDVWVDGSLAYDGATDTFQTGYNGPSSSRTVLPGNGHRIVIDPTSNFAEFVTVTVRVYAEDYASFVLDTTYTFETSDTTGPTIDNNFPVGTGVDKNANVTFSIHDPDSGVDADTINVVVGGQNAIVDGVFQGGFSGSITPSIDGYDVIVDKATSYASFTTISVSVSVDDNEGNPGAAGWSFTVEDYLGCLVTPISPTNGQTNYPTTGSITLTIEDEDSVVATSIMVEIDPGTGYEVAFDYDGVPQFKPGWDGPGSDVSELGGVFTIVIDPTSDFVVGSTILVRVTAADPTGNPERLA
jgi:hypothetical protein